MAAFSVIIPVYNAANTLPNCLESLQKQSLTDFEVIAVNDGSTDASLSLLEAFGKEFDQLTIQTQQNSGLGNARNRAANMAKGDWLVFLDADDSWQANKLELMHQTIAHNPETEFIYHAIFEKFTDGRLRKRSFTPVHNLQEFIMKGNPFVPSATAIKKSVFERFGGFIEDRDQVEDLLLWMNMLHQNVKIAALNKPLTIYRIGSGVTAHLEEHLQKIENSLQQALSGGLISRAEFSAFINRKNYEAARQLHKLGNHARARVFYSNVQHAGLKQRLLAAANKLGLIV
jgi:glycosyltransferase involved in cell wall biosynthesis